MQVPNSSERGENDIHVNHICGGRDCPMGHPNKATRGRMVDGNGDGGGEYYPRDFECPSAWQRNHAVDENSDDGRDCPTDWACPNGER
jgi:hypothetical protein